MATNKNEIILQLSDCSHSSSSDEIYIGPEHLSPSSRKRWTRQHERKREMKKERSDAALTRIFDDPSFPFFSIGCTNASSARAACAEHSREIFRHEASMDVHVFLLDFLYTYAGCEVELEPFIRSCSADVFHFFHKIPPFTNMATICLRVDRSCVTGTWSSHVNLSWINCIC